MRHLVICALVGIFSLSLLSACGGGDTKKDGGSANCKKALEYLDKVDGVYSAYEAKADIQRRLGELREQYAVHLDALPSEVRAKAVRYPENVGHCRSGVLKSACDNASEYRSAVEKACR